MNENDNNTTVDITTEDPTQKYIDKITEIQKNSVPRAEYEKAMNENKKLLDAMVNGSSAIEQERVEAKPTIEEMRNTLYGKDCEDIMDIKYVENLVNLRDTLLQETDVDYGAPTGSQLHADYNDLQSSQRVTDGLRHCLEVADGNQEVFFQELTRITSDGGMSVSRKINNKRR